MFLLIMSLLRYENLNLTKILFFVFFQNLTLGPQAKIEATMQHEITRMTSENLVNFKKIFSEKPGEF